MVEARNRNFLTERSIMVIFGLILLFFVPFLCAWLVFGLAIYALPLFVGVMAASFMSHHQTGVLEPFLAGLMAAAFCLAIGQVAFAVTRSLLLRCLIGLAYAVPAAMAGGSSATAIAQLVVPSASWGTLFGAFAAVLIGLAAFFRIAGPGTSAQASKPAVLGAAP